MMNHSDMVEDTKAILDGAKQAITDDDCCIYKVPVFVRKLKEDAYTPKVVSIGPFHHCGHPHLENMERYKLMFCEAFLERTGSSLDSLTRYIEGVELNIRRCYSETLKLSKEELVKVVLVDSCFIIELFLRHYHDGKWSANDNLILSKPWWACVTCLDLLLLENQLPFFVLDDLYNLSFSSASAHVVRESPSFLDLTFRYFSDYNRSNLSSTSSNVSIRHFTDLIRIFHLKHPLERRPDRIHNLVEHLPSASELVEAGMKLRVDTESECLLDLSFSGRVLKIPQLNLDDRTEPLFHNMVALEQCHYPYEAYITDYVKILEFLIKTGRDVDVLVRKGVLNNFLWDNDSLPGMFNGLCRNIVYIDCSDHYFDLSNDLNQFCRNPWSTLKATLKRDYCSNPWKTAASIAGILLLILTLLQSVCSVMQVVQQYNDSSN